MSLQYTNYKFTIQKYRNLWVDVGVTSVYSAFQLYKDYYTKTHRFMDGRWRCKFKVSLKPYKASNAKIDKVMGGRWRYPTYSVLQHLQNFQYTGGGRWRYKLNYSVLEVCKDYKTKTHNLLWVDVGVGNLRCP